ncbi:hypothetical protein [Cellulosimicrobium sp. BE325]|uniref:hypothetical protein n=1 Tax=Cellulosimicrobium sp. 4261 TaxID=3156458 RepID=UPI001AEAEF41
MGAAGRLRGIVPPRLDGFLYEVQRRLPLVVGERLDERYFGYSAADRPAPVAVPATGRRVYVAPANFAGQGYAWSRALERHVDDLTAVSMAPVRDGGFGFRVDDPVPYPVYAASRRWQRAQRKQVLRFTHVVLEAGRPLFPRLGAGTAAAEVAELRAHGLRVAMLFHGSDIRSPDRHAASSRWSPFHENGWEEVPRLREIAAVNKATATDLGVPVLVSTPDLLLDVPWARWCPVVVEPERWASGTPLLERERPLVVHAPSRGVVKGTALVEPALRELDAAGVIEYQPVSGVPNDAMPALYGEADVVVDQFRIGNYGVAACEAMAAGRVVVSHVDDQVRSAARDASGLDVPIVEATPDTLSDVLRRIAGDREAFREVASRGPRFVDTLHGGRFSARVLAETLDVL